MVERITKVQGRYRVKGDWPIWFIGILLALLLRFSLRDFQSGDFRDFTGPWYDAIRAGGGLSALRDVSSNYSPAYLYLLVAGSVTFAGLPQLYTIKLVSVIFDFVCAVFVYRLVRLRFPTGHLPQLAFFAVLFAPTMFLNSSLWGQADAIYTAGLIACLYFLLVERQIAAFVAFGLAFSVKLQALFLAPLLLILLLRGRLSWKNAFLVPITYLLTLVPAWLAGRPLGDLLTTYLAQANFYRSLTKNAPNLYQWLPNSHYEVLMPAGLILAVSAVFLLTLAAHKSSDNLSRESLILLGTFSVLLMPFILPKMHDRYFFAADLFSIVLAFYYPRFFYVPLIVGGVSFFSYLPFLFDQEPFPLSRLALVLLVLIVVLARQLAVELRLAESRLPRRLS